MDQDGLPAGFTITPYTFEPRAAEAKFEAGLGSTPVAWWRIVLRLAAAGLAAAAAWAQLIVRNFYPVNPDDGAQFRYDAWGKVSIRLSKGSDLEFGPMHGICYGPLLCAGAVVLVLAALFEWQPRRVRWQPNAGTLTSLAAAFLLAVAACEIAETLVTRNTTLTHYLLQHAWAPSWSPWRAIAGCLLAAASCLRLPVRRLPLVSRTNEEVLSTD